MQLNQVYTVHAQTFEGAIKLLFGTLISARAGFGGQEEVVAMFFHPRPNSQLRITIARGGIDVVDPVLQQQVERAVRLLLGHATQSGRAKKGASAHMTGATKAFFVNHFLPPRPNNGSLTSHTEWQDNL